MSRFFLADLQLRQLLNQTSVSDVKETIKNLPTKAEVIYCRMLLNIALQSLSRSTLAWRIILWLSYSQRPLTVPELLHAVAINSSTDRLDLERMPPSRFLEDVCMGLISIDAERNIVLFSSASLSCYMKDSREQRFPNGAREIAYGCLNYLNSTELTSGSCVDLSTLLNWLKKYPLMRYVMQHWGTHVNEYWQELVPNMVRTLLIDGRWCAAFGEMLDASEGLQASRLGEPISHMSGLHIAAYFNFVKSGSSSWLVWPIQSRHSSVRSVDSWQRTPLHIACERGNALFVHYLLKDDAPIDTQDRDGKSSLHYTAINGNLEIMISLLDRKPSLNLRDRIGKTALDYAVSNGHSTIVSELLKYGPENGEALQGAASINCTDILELLLDASVFSEQPKAYRAAASQGSEESLKLHFDEDVGGLNTADDQGVTALHIAAAAGLTTTVTLILMGRGDVMLRDCWGRTALFSAAEIGDELTLGTLLHHGAIIDARDKKGMTSLAVCVKNGHVDCVQYLLKRGAKPDSCLSPDSVDDDMAPKTALQVAAHYGQVEVVKFLFRKYFSRARRSDSDQIALSLATRGNHKEIVRLFLEHGANSNGLDEYGRRPLHYAAKYGHTELVQMLLKKGADIDAGDAMGQTALHLAAQGGYGQVVRWLLRYGAHVHAINTKGQTALHLAVETGHPAVIKVLLEWSFDVNIHNGDGQTPLLQAVQKGEIRCIRLLLRAGTDPNARDNEGRTPLEEANRIKISEISTLFHENTVEIRPGAESRVDGYLI